MGKVAVTGGIIDEIERLGPCAFSRALPRDEATVLLMRGAKNGRKLGKKNGGRGKD